MKRYAHHYNGKIAGRGSRQLSKLYKGIKKGDLTPVYQLLENEKINSQEQVRQIVWADCAEYRQV